MFISDEDRERHLVRARQASKTITEKIAQAYHDEMEEAILAVMAAGVPADRIQIIAAKVETAGMEVKMTGHIGFKPEGVCG